MRYQQLRGLLRRDLFHLLFKQILICIVVCFSTSCVSSNPPSSLMHNSDTETLQIFALEGVELVLVHIELDKQFSENLPREVEEGESIGVVATPDKLSDRYENALNASQNLYEKGEFAKAALIWEDAYRDEPDNPFILNAYARTLYKTESSREKAFQVYRHLLEILDRQTEEGGNNAVVIDVWFPEAYWKIATIYLDKNEYEKAAFEISRFLIVFKTLGNLENEAYRPLLTQALQYLTEAYFALRQDAIARYYAKKTLEINPSNEYCKRVLKFNKK